jgi:hypothetical protein
MDRKKTDKRVYTAGLRRSVYWLIILLSKFNFINIFYFSY